MDFIIITLILFILIGLSFYLKSQKASIPLIIIYLVFSFSENNNQKVQKNINQDSTDDNELVNKLSEEERMSENKDQTKNQKNQVKSNISDENKNIISPVIVEPEIESKKTDKVNKNIVKTSKKEIKEKIVKKQVPKTNQIRIEKKLVLKDIKICKVINNRKPVGVNTIFSNNVDSLFCHTKIENMGSKSEAKHIWYFENQIMTQVRYNVKKSKSYRSWTKKTILPYQVGNWRVDVQDENGTIIGSKKFRIKK